MEARLGEDLAHVRVHADERAGASALAAGARAYAAGSDVVFGAGRFAPETHDGRRLLAHELVHVVQQTRAAGAPAAPAAAEAQARKAGRHVAGGQTALVHAAASGPQRDELTEEDRRRISAADCPSGRCHEPIQSPPSGPVALGHPGTTAGSLGPSNVDAAALRRWLAPEQAPAAKAEPEPRVDKPTPVRKLAPPPEHKAPPGIASLAKQRKRVQVLEVFAPPTRSYTPLGDLRTTTFSQADVLAHYTAEIDQPDPTAGYNFDTYLWNVTTGRRIAAQHLGGTRFRVFMGTPECPGCHLGHGLEVDLKGQSFITVMAETYMAASALGGTARGLAALEAGPPLVAAEADEAALAASRRALRTPEHEFDEFDAMLRDEGATDFTAAGEPVTMQPHGGASRARATLGVTGEQQSMHGLPRAVGRHLPGYDPDAALTTLGERTLHTELDQPWKDAFQNFRRQGRTTASGQEIYDAVAGSIEQSALSPGLKQTLKLRLQDEMFVEYGLGHTQQLTLPYRNIRPRP